MTLFLIKEKRTKTFLKKKKKQRKKERTLETYPIKYQHVK